MAAGPNDGIRASLISTSRANLLDEIRNHKGFEKTKHVKAQDKRQSVNDELEARLALRRQAVSGQEIPTKGITRSLSDMISVAEPSDSENDSSEGESFQYKSKKCLTS